MFSPWLLYVMEFHINLILFDIKSITLIHLICFKLGIELEFQV